MDLTVSDPVKKDMDSFMNGMFSLAIAGALNLNQQADTTILYETLQKGANDMAYGMLYKMYQHSLSGVISDDKLGEMEDYLLVSIKYEDMEMAKYFLEKGADPWKNNSRGLCPMDEAITSGNIEMVELFQLYDLNIKEPSE